MRYGFGRLMVWLDRGGVGDEAWFVRAVGSLDVSPTLSGLLDQAIDRSLQAFDANEAPMVAALTADLTTRDGPPSDPERVHKYRVATRRLRSDLATFAPVVDAEAAGSLRTELGWLGRLVGEVRDADVQIGAMTEVLGTLGDVSEEEAGVVLGHLRARRLQALPRLLEAIGSSRQVALRAELERGAGPLLSPQLAACPADEVAPELLGRPVRHLRRAVRRLDAVPAHAELHRVRILAKRARYAAEALEPALGPDAERLAATLRRVQDVLGDHQDTVVAEGGLRELAAEEPSVAFLAGRLVEQERARRGAMRAAWPKAWKDVHRQIALAKDVLWV